jgi:uncharacterized protein YegL
MKDNFIHVCFVIDESGSMNGTEGDVIGGFKKVVDEQKAIKDGTCSVSYFKFASDVEKVYIGKDINEVEYLDGKYHPGGLTALFDGVGTAIDEIGKWIDKMPESEKPEKNLIVVMTDGGENNSKDYTASKVKEMIKHQEDKYNWSFIYMGSDLKDAQDANSLGFGTKLYSSKSDYMNNYDTINFALSSYRCMTGSTELKSDVLNETLCASAEEATKKYAAENNLDANDLL